MRHLSRDLTVMTVSLIIPVYNERQTLPKILDRIVSCGVRLHQILVVDDGSTDGTKEYLRDRSDAPPLEVLHHETNCGKGAAIGTALRHATGDIIAIQDADLEYDPADLAELLSPILEDRADAVFGSRFAGDKIRRVAYHRQRWGNWLLTKLSNFFTGLELSDMECGYKAFRRELLQGVTVEESSFGFEPEITAKVAQKKPRVCEVSVSYRARTFAEGKKIRWHDGLRAMYAILRYNVLR